MSQEMQSLRDILFHNPKIVPERKAILFEERWHSFAELQARVGAVGAALKRAGVEHGDRVAVLLQNRPEFFETYFAITGIGAIFVPLNWRLHVAEHAVLLTDAEPKLLITERAYAPNLERLRQSVPSLTQIVVVDKDGSAAADSYEAWIAPTQGMPLPEAAGLDPDTDAAMLYTSGTTSRPKGVVLTHGNYLAEFADLASIVGVNENSLNLQISPLYHAACIHSFFHLAYGAATVLIDKFEAGEALRLIEKERVSYFFAAPTAIYQMMDIPDFARCDHSSLKAISYGAASISKTRLMEVGQAFGPILIHAYGMTETTSHASALLPADHAIALGSIGKGTNACEIRLVNLEGKVCRTDEIGEIIVRGPNVMKKGYWKRPDATAEAIRDGWLYTGDLAHYDENGFIYVVDRKKDMIISGGVNIYPREIEEVIAAHPAVAEVAAYGVPDEHWGEALAASVVLREGKTASAQEISDFCRGRIGGYKVPKLIKIIDALPKTATGKIRKIDLRKNASAL
ncbi:MAG: long-chain-fatty-acid--CoA ligase [Desulfobulbaceae bacterium]|jgi:acyl-CoA synthetase (AMP-forming)/AMP-acid ligase II|nr:long-chain-fatty-acid--CoA ligase [Desulfobulbaceae bacterium]